MKKNIFLIAFAFFIASMGMAQSNEQPPQPPKPPTPEEQLKKVDNELKKYPELTGLQKERILSAYKTFFAEMDKNRSKEMPPPPPPPPVKKEIADKLAADRDAKIKEVLSEEQFRKYLEIEKKLRPRHRRPDGEAPPKEDEQKPMP